MKVLFIGGLQCGGSEHQMVTVAKQLSENGYAVYFATYDTNDFHTAELKNSQVRIVGIPRNQLVQIFKLTIPYTILFLYHLVKKEKISVGVAFLNEWNFVVCYISKLMKGKFKAITGLRNARDSVFLSKRNLFFTKYECYASLKVCNSYNAQNIFSKYFPHCAKKLLTIYNIVNLPQVTSEYIPRRDGKTHIIVPASYREVKNPFGLLRALELMNKDELNMFDITWYGQTFEGTLPYYVKLKNEVARQRLEDTFILKEATNDIVNRVYEADIVALFSSSEGLPNAICEGMMLGKPVIMTRVSDYQVLTEGNGILCDWDNPLSIKNAIIKMANSSVNELVHMKQVSQDKANRLFSLRSNVEKWKNVIANSNT